MTRSAPPVRKMTGTGLMRRLRHHYQPPTEMLPGGVFVEEVGQNNSSAGGNRCDAVWVGFTSSSGRIMTGFELKVTRADWHHELESHTKADYWSDACHAWYVVAPSTTIVDPLTVPHNWGLLIPDPKRPSKMRTIIKAAVKPDHNPPWDAVRGVFARQDTMRHRRIIDLTRHQVDLAVKAGIEHHERSRGTSSGTAVTADQVRNLEVMESFRSAHVTLSAWRGKDGDAVIPADLTDPGIRRMLRDATNVETARKQLVGRYSQLSRLREQLDALAGALDALGEAPDATNDPPRRVPGKRSADTDE